jgi:hypothetical protein
VVVLKCTMENIQELRADESTPWTLDVRETKIAQRWPKLWANFRALIGIFSQRVGPSLAIWANPVQFSFG